MARYEFVVRFRIEPQAEGVSLDPASFRTRLARSADPSDESEWFFRDNLWRGELNHPSHFRRLAEEALGVPVEGVEYRRYVTDSHGYDELKGAIGANLEEFNASNVSEVLNKYFGSSIDVIDTDG